MKILNWINVCIWALVALSNFITGDLRFGFAALLISAAFIQFILADNLIEALKARLEELPKE